MYVTSYALSSQLKPFFELQEHSNPPPPPLRSSSVTSNQRILDNAVKKQPQQQQQSGILDTTVPSSSSKLLTKSTTEKETTTTRIDFEEDSTANDAPTKDEETASAAAATACTCTSSSTDDSCCTRRVLCSHKLGHVLSRSLFMDNRFAKRFSNVVVDLQPPPITDDFFSETQVARHREVLVTRDFFDSVVSGYLYHQTGRECWLEPKGRKRPKDFDIYDVQRAPLQAAQHAAWRDTTPPDLVRGRNMCEFLRDESEEVGLRVFANFSWYFWYKEVYQFGLQVQQREQQENSDDSKPRRTIFVCYDDLNDPGRQLITFRGMMNHLNPTGYDRRLDPAPTSEAYSGKHSTSRDPELRGRLRSTVERLDKQELNNVLSTANALFGCAQKEDENSSSNSSTIHEAESMV